MCASDTIRLQKLLCRFGLESRSGGASIQQDLRQAFLDQAKMLHPDGGGTHTKFVRLKQEHDEALGLLKRMSFAQHASRFRSTSSRNAHPRYGYSIWTLHGHDCQRSQNLWREDTLSGLKPGAPPSQVIWFGGSCLALWFALWLCPRSTIPADAVSLAAHERIKHIAKSEIAKQIQNNPAHARKETEASRYYRKRSNQMKPSETLKKRPHARQRGSTYVSPIHAAAEDGLAGWLHFFGERGTPVMQFDRHMQTPLHYAAHAGQYDACAVLLKFKASPTYPDSKGKSPLDLAREGGWDVVAEMLKQGPPGPFADRNLKIEESPR